MEGSGRGPQGLSRRVNKIPVRYKDRDSKAGPSKHANDSYRVESEFQ